MINRPRYKEIIARENDANTYGRVHGSDFNNDDTGSLWRRENDE